MITAIENHIAQFDAETQQRFNTLYQLALESTTREVEQKLWAKLPSIYSGKNFVRLIPFKNHINIEATEIVAHKSELCAYSLTPKGMLQVAHKQAIPVELLKRIFKETFEAA